MAVTTMPSQNPKPAPSDVPRPLTMQEIESLRQDAREGHLWFQEAIKKMDLKPLR
jgi:hypothetical protein